MEVTSKASSNDFASQVTVKDDSSAKKDGNAA